jgi:hypothetical protein
MGETLLINKSGFGGQEKWGHLFFFHDKKPCWGSTGVKGKHTETSVG